MSNPDHHHHQPPRRDGHSYGRSGGAADREKRSLLEYPPPDPEAPEAEEEEEWLSEEPILVTPNSSRTTSFCIWLTSGLIILCVVALIFGRAILPTGRPSAPSTASADMGMTPTAAPRLDSSQSPNLPDHTEKAFQDSPDEVIIPIDDVTLENDFPDQGETTPAEELDHRSPDSTESSEGTTPAMSNPKSDSQVPIPTMAPTQPTKVNSTQVDPANSPFSQETDPNNASSDPATDDPSSNSTDGIDHEIPLVDFDDDPIVAEERGSDYVASNGTEHENGTPEKVEGFTNETASENSNKTNTDVSQPNLAPSPDNESIIDPTTSFIGDSDELTSNHNVGDITSIASSNPMVKTEELVPHVVFDDLHFRRVCAPVHSSVLCMTMRFPFLAPLQDPTVSFPKPVDPKFYTLMGDKGGFNYIDQADLEACRNRHENKTDVEATVKKCLEEDVAMSGIPNRVAVIWTRRRMDKQGQVTTTLFGTRSEQQLHNLGEFFGQEHTILVAGASPTPGVTVSIQGLWARCSQTEFTAGFTCTPSKRHRLGGKDHLPDERERPNSTYVGVISYFPEHALPHQSFVEYLAGQPYFPRPANMKKRKLTIIIEFAIAHTQNQDWIYNQTDKVKELQTGFPVMALNITSKEGRRALNDMGYELANFIAYDGLPQSFPTETGAYVDMIHTYGSSKDLVAHPYPGWRPELGDNCRGPLPPNSLLTMVNSWSRQSFQDHGHDMRFYGRTWEFANLLWWDQKGFRGMHPLMDCTHSLTNIFYSTHRFFLQAMVDDAVLNP